MTKAERLQFVVDRTSEGYSRRDIMNMMGYASPASVTKLASEAKSLESVARLLKRWGLDGGVPIDEN